MKNKDNRPEQAAELRKRAEEIARRKAAQSSENIAAQPPEEVLRTLHELRVHQIELELQNEELRRAQEELAAARARYFDLYDLAPVGYCAVSEKGLILEANLTAANLLGAARGALARQPLSRFIITDDQDVYYLHRRQLFETGAPQVCELRLVKKDGTSFWALLEGSVAEDADGAPVCRLVLSDINERKLAELEIDKLNRDLIENKREMENFLYIATHDLRSPLVNIQGFSQNLERYIMELRELLAPISLSAGSKAALDKLTGDRIPGALKFVLKSSLKMDSLITALLKVARLGRVEMRPESVDMNELIKKILLSLRYQLENAGGEIRCGNLPPCKADPAAVSQLFTNLLDNTLKYRHKDRALAVTVTGQASGGMVLYTVADNGAGIPATDLHRIWNVFYQSEREYGRKGEGIGLPMARRIIEKNGGSITAESKEGEGSIFRLELPAAGDEKNAKR